MFDLRSILIVPGFYTLLQNLVRSKKHIKQYVNQYIKPKTGDVILDIGCGPADILDFLPQVRYYGFDSSSKYINKARKKYNNHGKFFCQELSIVKLPQDITFNIVLASNVLHHLDDEEAVKLFQLAKTCLKDGGRLITCDGCHADDEGFISNVILSLDRGKYVRRKEDYLNLASKVFHNIKHDIRKDLTRIPINGIIMSCTKDDKTFKTSNF